MIPTSEETNERLNGIEVGAIVYVTLKPDRQKQYDGLLHGAGWHRAYAGNLWGILEDPVFRGGKAVYVSHFAAHEATMNDPHIVVPSEDIWSIQNLATFGAVGSGHSKYWDDVKHFPKAERYLRYMMLRDWGPIR